MLILTNKHDEVALFGEVFDWSTTRNIVSCGSASVIVDGTEHLYENVESVPDDLTYDSKYCYTDAGFTVNPAYIPPVPDITPEPAPAPVDPLTELQEENKRLRGKISALVESNGMLEECVVELAQLVYA